jgi:hypothetical protein
MTKVVGSNPGTLNWMNVRRDDARHAITLKKIESKKVNNLNKVRLG